MLLYLIGVVVLTAISLIAGNTSPAGASSKCVTAGCNDEMLRHRRTVQFHEQLVRNLKIDPSTRPALTEEEIRIIDNMREAFPDGEIPTTSRGAAKHSSLQLIGRPGENEGTVYFKVSNATKKAHIEHASLKIALRSPIMEIPDGESIELQVSVYEVLPQSDQTTEEIAERTVQIPINSNKKRHISIPLDMEDVQRWVDEGGSFGLQIAAFYNGENLFVYPDPEDQHEIPVLLHFTVGEPPHRQKRNHPVVCSKEEKGCCLHDHIINFAEIGWDFIVAPRSVNIYRCGGDCTADLLEYTDEQQKKLANSGIWERPFMMKANSTDLCCFASKFDVNSKILFMNTHGVVMTTTVPNIVIKECICG